jgi:pSer/pThr/pTyr-binding forkhead associated (FHA) protein
MPEPLLRVLTILVMVLLYLFFLRVLRAVWAEVNPPKVAPATTKPAKGARRAARPRGRHTAPQLRVVEPADQRGRAYPLGDEITVGRAAGCQVTLDDTYVSQLHARVFNHDGQVLVEDLGSTNGTYLNRRKVTGPMVMNRGDQLQIGSTVLELA